MRVAVAPSLALAAALAACSGVEHPASPTVAGEVALDASGTAAVRVPLERPAYDVPPSDSPWTCEVRVCHAADGLPREIAPDPRDTERIRGPVPGPTSRGS